jgi:hypothetical protein
VCMMLTAGKSMQLSRGGAAVLRLAANRDDDRQGAELMKDVNGFTIRVGGTWYLAGSDWSGGVPRRPIGMYVARICRAFSN